MTITLTYKQMNEAIRPLTTLMSKPISGAQALRLARIVKDFNEELSTFREQHIALLKKHGAVEGDDGNLSAPPEKADLVQSEYAEMLAVEVRLNHAPLPMKALDKIDMTASDMMALDWLFAG